MRTVKHSVSIPEDVFQAAEDLARRLDMPRSHLYARALEEFLARRSEEDVTARLDALCGEEDTSLDPVLAAVQWSSLPREDWTEEA